MIHDPWSGFRGKRILLLQGPVGPFFRRLSRLLKAVGAQVYKVNFNGGDWLFYPTGAAAWQGCIADWPEYFEALLEDRDIDVVLLFGDCRPIHQAARDIAHRRGVMVGAFEEGYVRPNFITFDQFGVNGHSLVPKRPLFYRGYPKTATVIEHEIGHTFWYAALWAALYYAASALLRPLFLRYLHHRRLSVLEALPWLRSGWRKLFYRWKERGVIDRLTGPLRKQYFLVPLQVSVDSQVMEHSAFDNVGSFIRRTVESFARHAPADTVLVIKHHPMDRGYNDYGRLIRDLGRRLGLRSRLLYIHDQHLPTLFEHMRGAVVINSTGGLSALTHGAPVKTCGVAVYDMPGLTFQGSLDAFWRGAETFRPDHDLFLRFRAYLIDRTQINGSFYKGLVDAEFCARMASWQMPDAVAPPAADPAATVIPAAAAIPAAAVIPAKAGIQQINGGSAVAAYNMREQA